ncbi:NAD(P)H-dependent oxidoreductase [Pseudorhodobacter sp. E13]|uniref:NADPH-dependent FMN reductase n=1 Tax=Pseudorhodobacter sp. E13 TaxID=2487931 RepID=UPI000F8CAF9D|nr:NAD(P)H-dependent oxidoreductase [Pseudorhodobacter sp. E13]RUS61039.1 NAD(P)H-dependent oxidoreductase [Pseudorhodobacter sp. E13]
MAEHNILGICGALRSGSTNRALLAEAMRHYGPAHYVEADLRLPLYDGDLEAESGIPATVQTLADQIRAADAVLISTPEYNSALPGVLKNALDWVSRVPGGSPWAGKPVAIMSAAAGRAGGARSQFSLRLCLAPFRPRLLQGPEMLLAASGSAFDAAGHLKDPQSEKALTALLDALRAEVALLAK